MATYPRSWSKLLSNLEGSDLPDGVGEFLARYSMAKSYERTSFRGMHVSTARGYSLLMKAGLSYSAVESIERLMHGGKRIYLQLDESDLVSMFRDTKAEKLLDALIDNAESDKLSNNLKDFKSSVLSDLHPIAAAIRHLTFHGVGNPHKLGLDRSKFIRTCIDDIADLQLDMASNEFSKYVEGFTR